MIYNKCLKRYTCTWQSMNQMTGVMRKGPLSFDAQFSESDVKVCEFEKSKSRHVNPEMVLFASFDLHFL